MAGSQRRPLAFNLHLTAACNMRCAHCHSRFRMRPAIPASDWHSILVEIHAWAAQSRTLCKVTLAGGEPLLLPYLGDLIGHAKDLGLLVSVITNGALIRERAQDGTLDRVDEVGISIDSNSPPTNRQIGRCLAADQCIDYGAACKAVQQLRKRLKVNTVVCRANVAERLTGMMNEMHPDRWKILQARLVLGENDDAASTIVTRWAYRRFLERNRAGLDATISVAAESSADQLASYLMVDPSGVLFDATDGACRRSQPVVEVGLATAMRQIRFRYGRFVRRGGTHFRDWASVGSVEAEPAAVTTKGGNHGQ